MGYTKAFETLYFYEGEDLGSTYNKEQTTFKLWAPTAHRVQLMLYDQGNKGKLINQVEMKPGIKGTWETQVKGNLNGTYYTYHVLINDAWKEVTDPYAKATGVNGVRAMVIDLKETNPKGWNEQKIPKLENYTDAILYELHIRDLSTHENSGITNKGKFLGLAEEGTTMPNGVSTGLNHIKELGVTHIHLLPAFDYQSIDEDTLEQNNFNWGYDPKNYNVPEGSYATDPYHGEVRIKEFKEAIQTLHNNGLGVVMDVVYNHTAQSGDSNLNLIVPDYYYRKTEEGLFSNGSGCGNELASERAMVRKMIVESVTYWAEEYKIDGFRFDLMGVLDIETMNQISKEVKAINPSIILYGEGWTGGDSTLPDEKKALKANAMQLDDIAVFSDDLRDGIRGHVFNSTEAGFVNGGKGFEETIKFGIVGATEHPQIDYSLVNYSKAPYAKSPNQTINYASAHDNLTLWDKLEVTSPNDGLEERLKMYKLSNAIVLTSQGVPFLQAGEEMVRTKGGNENSFSSSDEVNQLDWMQKSAYKDIFDYYKGLITLRKSHPAFRMTTTEDLQKHLSFLDITEANVVGYTIKDHANKDDWEEIVVLFNGNKEGKELELARYNWNVVVNEKVAGIETLEVIEGNKVSIPGRSAMVLVKQTEEVQEKGIDEREGKKSVANNKNKIPYALMGLVALGGVTATGLRIRHKMKNKK